MKIRELIERLKDENPEAEVHFAYGYGDYWRTTVTEEVKDVTEENVTWSDYHKSFALGREEDKDDGETKTKQGKKVIVLHARLR